MPENKSMGDVSVIGLGAMGAKLALALINSGREVVVWNRVRSKATPIVEAGAILTMSVGDAVRASPVTVVCISNHRDALQLFQVDPDSVVDKLVVELSSGDGPDGAALADWIGSHHGQYLTGDIISYPEGIGKADTMIVVTGADDAWHIGEPILKCLGGRTTRIGVDHAKLATINAALGSARLGFMFGMIDGALMCEKLGVPADVYLEMLPSTFPLMADYVDLASRTIPTEQFENPSATLATYADAVNDISKGFEEAGINAAFFEFIGAQLQRGIDAGLGDQELTSIIKILR
jgi:3-hydroxyisobutyrate dehydrogenase-like beta-hydroxyacid dehydrogenase